MSLQLAFREVQLGQKRAETGKMSLQLAFQKLTLCQKHVGKRKVDL